MNAAAKVIHQSNLFTGHWTDIQMSKSIYLLLILLIAVLMSALAVIYSTNSYRCVLDQLQREHQQTHFLKLQWGQLLLEQTSLATPSRVKELASKNLGMSLPTIKNTYILRAVSK